MVRRVWLLLAALLLPGCRFFTASFFPGYLAQAEKSWDLGPRIDSFLAGLGSTDYRWHPQVFVLTTSASVDYGGVLIEIDSRPEKLLLMAAPSGTVQQLVDTAGNFGRLRLKDLVGDFVVGGWHFAPGSLPAAVYSGTVVPSYTGFSEDIGSNNWVVFSADSASITYQRYDSSWSSGGATNIGVSSDGGNYELRAAYYDPLALTDQEVALVFFDSAYNRVRAFRAPRARFIDTTLAILDTYPSLQFEDTDADRVLYTHKGMVLIDDRAAVLTDFNGNETNKRLTLGQGGNSRLAFDVEGAVFYVFDEQSRMLYRGKTGW